MSYLPAPDFRVAFRTLRKEWRYSVFATLILGLGLGTVTVSLSLARAALLRGLPFVEADRLVDVQLVDGATFREDDFKGRTTTADLRDLRQANLGAFESIGGYVNGSAATGVISGATVNLSTGERPRRYTGGYVTHNFFQILRVQPMMGRDFTPEDDRMGAPPVILLSHAVWQVDFGGDPVVVGRAIRANGAVATIIGVMPEGFQFPNREDLWLPITPAFPPRHRNDSLINYAAIVGRLRPGATLHEAQTQIDGLARQVAAEFPDTNRQFSSGLARPLINYFAGPAVRRGLYAILVFALVVLALACASVMNMQLARGMARTREHAVCAALGASRAQLIGRPLGESLLLGLAGLGLGAIVATLSIAYLKGALGQVGDPLPAWMDFSLDPQVMLMAAAVALSVSLIAGLLPALLASRVSLLAALRAEGKGVAVASSGHWSGALVAIQIGVTSVLLVAALLQVFSLQRQQETDYGYNPRGLLAARLALMEGDYPTNGKRREFFDQLVVAARAQPEFEAAALTSRLQMALGGQATIEIEGMIYQADHERPDARHESVSADYAQVLGLRVLEGRFIRDEDTDQREPVAIVNSSFARRHFGGESALGRRFRTIAANGLNPGPWRKIVGVVSDVRMVDPRNNSTDNAGFYLPFLASVQGATPAAPFARQFATLVARPRGNRDGRALEAALRATVRRVDPNLPPYFVQTPAESFAEYFSQTRVNASIFTALAILAVLLAVTGLHGVQSVAVEQRRREFGIRMALGASRGSIIGTVVRRAFWPVAAGILGGGAVTLFAGTLAGSALRDFLYRTSPTDWTTHTLVILLLAGVAFTTVLATALRAARTNPMRALRD